MKTHKYASSWNWCVLRSPQKCFFFFFNFILKHWPNEAQWLFFPFFILFYFLHTLKVNDMHITRTLIIRIIYNYCCTCMPSGYYC